MIGEQDSFDAEATPVVGKIREGDPPLFILAVGTVFVLKMINTLELANVALILLSVMLVGEFLFYLKKIREE